MASAVHGRIAEEPSAPSDPVTAPASLLAGAFTAEQAEGGKALYAENCAGCHGAALRGSPGGPPIAGFKFKQTWQGTPVGALFSFISTQMPPGKEGTLTDEQYVDTIAYILSKNGYSSGATALPTDTAKLDEMIIEPLPASPAS
ncbi:MAG: cytochrome c [Sphingobium sp.]